jgi:hypothetical protein
MKIKRLALFELVWNKPMTALSKEFNLSDNGLRKICKKHDIPLPPMGYWMKLEFGKASPKPKILNPQINPEIELDTYRAQIAKVINEKQKATDAVIQSQPHLLIQVPDALIDPDPLVISTIKKVEDYKRRAEYHQRNPDKGLISTSERNYPPPEDKGRYYFHPHEKALPIVASFSQADRILRFLDALIKALKAQDFKIGLSKQENEYQRKLLVSRDGEDMTFSMREGYGWAQLSPKQKSIVEANVRYHYGDKVGHPNGNILFEVIPINGHSIKTFKDNKKQSLEQQLGVIVQTFMAFPQLQKDDRERRAREQAEREKRHQIWEHNQSISRNQRQQYEEAIKEAAKYRELQLLDDYLLKVEAEATKLNQIEGEVANFWLKVVRAHAENESPLNKRIAHLKKLASPVKSSWEGMWMAGEIKE